MRSEASKKKVVTAKKREKVVRVVLMKPEAGSKNHFDKISGTE